MVNVIAKAYTTVMFFVSIGFLIFCLLPSSVLPKAVDELQKFLCQASVVNSTKKQVGNIRDSQHDVQTTPKYTPRAQPTASLIRQDPNKVHDISKSLVKMTPPNYSALSARSKLEIDPADEINITSPVAVDVTEMNEVS